MFTGFLAGESHQIPLLVSVQDKQGRNGASQHWFEKHRTEAVLAWAAKPCWEPWQTYRDYSTNPLLHLPHPQPEGIKLFLSSSLNPTQNHTKQHSPLCHFIGNPHLGQHSCPWQSFFFQRAVSAFSVLLGLSDWSIYLLIYPERLFGFNYFFKF